ncbi:MAG TPA: hypothetical protein PLB49_07870 [Chitinophagaceae bacterium]|nr:hypothetical protein [Chitinophagaceae bacterium]
MRFRMIVLGFLICGFTGSFLHAQDNLAKNNFMSEKVHLHIDRYVFGAGETVWFKAYILSGDTSGLTSSVLHVELLLGDSLLSYQRLPVVLSVSNGQFFLADSLVTGWYTVRAYTEAMLNQQPNSFFQSSIFIHGRKNGQKSQTDVFRDSMLVSFFPEGGNLVKGLESTVAFKATDEWGFPVDFSGVVRAENGDSIAVANTFKFGMGEFKLRPSIGQRYYVSTSVKGSIIKYYLPEVVDEGVALSMIYHPEGIYFELNQAGSNRMKNASVVVGHMFQKEVFRRKITDKENTFQGVLNTKQLTSGILAVTVLNDDGLPLAERLIFINNKEYRQAVKIIADTVDFRSKARNYLKIALTDTVLGSLSLSITNADYGYTSVRPASIISDLLLTSELKGDIVNPDWYFQEGNDSVSTGLDLLMLTQGWRNYKWAIHDKNSDLSKLYKDPAYITIRGRALLRGTKSPLSDSRLMVVLSAKGITNNILLTETDKQGYFTIDSLLFFGKARFYFAEQREKKKARYIDIIISEGISSDKLLPEKRARQLLVDRQHQHYQKIPDSIINYLEEITRAEGKMMQGVTVTAKMKTPVEKLEDEYTVGAFSTNAFVERVIDLVNTNEPVVQPNIFEYLKSRIPGLMIADPDLSKSPPDPSQPGFDPRNDPTKLRLFYRQMPSVSSLGNPPMVVYLNEIETDPDVIATIPAAEIALIKIYSSFVSAPGAGPGGVMAIYTKKSKDMSDPLGSTISYEGFSVIKEFFAPNYKADPSIIFKPDTRITIDWRPNIFVNNIDPVIPISFYNSDRTKRFRVVVEGMTTSGKLISIEQIISK